MGHQCGKHDCSSLWLQHNSRICCRLPQFNVGGIKQKRKLITEAVDDEKKLMYDMGVFDGRLKAESSADAGLAFRST